MTTKEFCYNKTLTQIVKDLEKLHKEKQPQQENKIYKKIYDWEGYALEVPLNKTIYKEEYLKNYKKYNSILKRINDRLNEINIYFTNSYKEYPRNPYIELLDVALYCSNFYNHNFHKYPFKKIFELYNEKIDITEVNWYYVICGYLVDKFVELKEGIEDTLKTKNTEKERYVKDIIIYINDYINQIGTMMDIIKSVIKKDIEIDIEKVIKENNLLNTKYKKLNKGFNNITYELEDYIIKICINKNNETKFLNEINFYKENNNKYIPKLYKSDISKKIIPYYYQILEKITGKTLYEVWYKLDKEERKDIVLEIIKLLKTIHKKKDGNSFKNFIKERLIKVLKKCELEDELFHNLLDYCDVYFNKVDLYTLHGDVHFDNIIYHDKKIKLIDFERTMLGPIDYEYRYLNQYKTRPWKWASETSDLLTIEADYDEVMDIILENDERLKKIPYLEERLTVYEILDLLQVYLHNNDEELLDKIKKKIIILKYNK